MKLELITKEPTSPSHETPIVFVHGAWHGAWCWEENFMPYFAEKGFSCHAFSMRGHGKSEGKEKLRWTSLMRYVDDLGQVASSMKKPPVIVAHSLGGAVTQRYLEKHNVPACVLLAPVPPWGVVPLTLRILLRHPWVFLKANLTLSLYPVVETPELTREAFFSEDIPQEKVMGYYKRMQDESYRMYWDIMFLSLPKPKRVQTPILVLGAEKDRVFSRSDLNHTAKAYHTEAEVFPMAHDMMLEPGWQKVADRIIGWLGSRGL
ncbi:MAG: alpha/beta fold hydrolase [Smithellaceae bacterium]|nr:alpha/beta fold hydrolase [Smithellaceae bacterium]